ncbi:MAG: peptide deformylase [Alphaproteobacteria bacterium]|nr:peptide deformylase [Alphaproteobacteria bacterium]
MSDVYEIIKVPDPVLKQSAQAIENISADIQTQAQKMVDTMYYGAGIGLAANQVNILNRIFVMDVPEGAWRHGPEIDGVLTIEAGYRSGEAEEGRIRAPRVFINPEVVWESEQKSVYEEGCLSIPLQYAEVIRPAQVRVKFQDLKGDMHEEEFDGLDSHCVQHEIDHLNGVLFFDYISALKRNMMIKRVKKITKEAQAL